MFKQIIDLASKLFGLLQRIQKQEEVTKELQQELKALGQKVDQNAVFTLDLAYQFQRDRENAERDREIQRLQLENIPLRSERRLLPGAQQDRTETESLQEQIDALKQEVAELRQRMEQVEKRRK